LILFHAKSFFRYRSHPAIYPKSVVYKWKESVSAYIYKFLNECEICVVLCEVG